jgi:hypothetical protein
MVYDMPVDDSYVLNSLQIDGRLSFSTNSDVHLLSKQIWVKNGQLVAGEEALPAENEIRITLVGAHDDDTAVIDGILGAGNKVLINTGTIKLFGKQRSQRSRLTATVNPGSSTAFVEAQLDW